MKRLVVSMLLVVGLLIGGKVVFAQDCGANLDCQIAAIQKEIDALTPAHENNKAELSELNKQIVSLKAKIAAISGQLSDLEAEILVREEDLIYTRRIFNEKASSHYSRCAPR